MMMRFERKLSICIGIFGEFIVRVGMYIYHTIIDMAMNKIRNTAKVSYITGVILGLCILSSHSKAISSSSFRYIY